MPALVICNRMPFSQDGLNKVSSNIRQENSIRYLREWTNPSMRESADFFPEPSSSLQRGADILAQYIPSLGRNSTIQMMQYDCQSVVSSCSYQNVQLSSYDCCKNLLSSSVASLVGLCWILHDRSMIQNTTGPDKQFNILFQIPRNSWFAQYMPTHPGVDVFLVEGGGDASTVGVYLENPIHLRDKKGVRLKMHKQRQALTRRPECGQALGDSRRADQSAFENNKTAILMCHIAVSTKYCGCHPVMGDMMAFDKQKFREFARMLEQTNVCGVEQYEGCSRRYIDAAQACALSNMEPPAKRLRVQEESGPTDEPSPVVLLTDLSPLVTEADLLEALSPFGLINYAAVKRYRAVTGLVEFEEIESALACVKSSATSTVYITGTEATIAFSTLKSIPRHGFESPHPNHVLVLTVSNLTYNITANILKEICSAHGQVLRIAIVKRTSILVALVEFPSADIAKIVKHAINGADIYSGCCTLKVEFASVDRVRITILDSDHIDLTVPKERSYGGSQPSLPKSTPGLPPTNGYRREGIPADPYALDPYERRQPPSFDIDPRDELYARDSRDLYSREPHVDRYGGGRDPVARSSWGDEYPRDRTAYGYGAHYLYLPPRTARSSYEEFSASYQAALDHHSRAPRIAETVQPKAEYFGDIDPTMMYGGAGCVVMVYGVDQMKLNCDKVFNIFCQYGNVLRILFMKQKENTAILEMGAPEQAKNLINYLNGVELFGLQLELKHSVQNAVRHVNNPFSLPDNTPSYRDYTQSRNQRFHNQMAGERNRLCHPQAVLHWFNAPPEMDGEKISEMFVQRGAAAPIATHVFNSRTGRSASGTVEFASVLDATEAIALANHTPVSSDAGKHPFIVKLSFTQSRAPGTRPYEGGGDNTKIREASSARQGYRGGSERIQSPGGL